jgi:hypothetical protein
MKLGSSERCFLLHPSGHHLQSEWVEVEGKDMLEVEGMNILAERPSKQ